MNTIVAQILNFCTIVLMAIFVIWKRIPILRNILPWACTKMKKRCKFTERNINLIAICWLMTLNPINNHIYNSLYNIHFLKMMWSMFAREQRLKMKLGSIIPTNINLLSLSDNKIVNLAQIFPSNKPLLINCGSCT